MVKSKSYIPQRGDLVWLNFSPQSGHEQYGRRPALVISPYEYNRKTNLALFCPVTNQAKGYPFEVQIPEGLPIKGVVLSDHIKNLDWKIREAEYISQIPDHIFTDVLNKINVLIHP